jgi:hypothetical protein
MRIRNGSLAILAIAAAAVGQINATATITSGNITYSQSALPTGNAPGQNDVLNAGTGDVLYQHWWWYRVSGDTAETPFKQAGAIVRQAGGPAMTTAWSDVDLRGLFSAQLLQQVFSTGANGGYMAENLILQNLTNAPLTIDVFAYTDFDIADSGNNLCKGDVHSQVVVEDPTTAMAAEFLAVGNTGSLVGPYPLLRSRLADATVDTFSPWSGTWGAGDYTGLAQWTITLPPNGTQTVDLYLSSMRGRPALTNYGTGAAGSAGVPTIDADVFAVQDRIGVRQCNLLLANGAANSMAACLLSLGQANTNVFGLQILVDLNVVDIAFAPVDANGRASRGLPIPPTSPDLRGLDLFAQWLVSDTSAANGLASYSGGLSLELGAW